MGPVLILSSFVATGRVGGGAQTLALARLGFDPILVPTVLFGRHPGWGQPGGSPVEPATMSGVLKGIEAQGLFARFSAVITGHFSLGEQVALAAGAIDAVRAVNPAVRIVVDPILGDAPKGLYVREPVAAALVEDLVPRADLLAPNAWELEYLTGRPVTDGASAAEAARALSKPVLVSSLAAGGEIAVAYAHEGRAWVAHHPREQRAPHGTGDLLTALFTAALLEARAVHDALQVAVGGVAEAVALAAGDQELPIAALPTRLAASARVRLETLGG